MNVNISSKYFFNQYVNNIDRYVVNNIDDESDVIISKTPILLGECRFRITLFMKKKVLNKVILVAVVEQKNRLYRELSTREVHESWIKRNLGISSGNPRPFNDRVVHTLNLKKLMIKKK